MRELSSAVVLGGAGFLGGWIVEELRADGIEVAVVDDLSAVHAVPAESSGLVVADVREANLTTLFAEREVDVVFQLAGSASVPASIEDPLEDLQRNIGTTVSALEAARRSPRKPIVALASSAAVYGEGKRMPMDEAHPLEPVSPYGVAKLAAEEYVRMFHRLHGVPGICLRMFSLYGPRQRKLVVYDLLTRVCAGEDPLRVLAPGEISRDFVYVRDAARAFVELARRAPAHGEAYNVASGRAVTLRELADAVVAAAGASCSVAFTGSIRAGDPSRWEGDPSRASILGVECATTLPEGLGATAEWFRSGEPVELSPRRPTDLADGDGCRPRHTHSMVRRNP